MATGADNISIPEHFFICGICQKTLQSPKQLGCLHSFCSKCVEKHFEPDLDTADDNTGETDPQVRCPICHTSLHRSGDVADAIFTSSLAALSVSDKPGPGIQCARHPLEELCKFCSSRDMLLCNKCLEGTSLHGRCNVGPIPLSMLDKMCKKKQSVVDDSIAGTKSDIDSVCQDLLKHQTENRQTKEEIKQKIKLQFMTLRDDIACRLREQEEKIQAEFELQFDQTNTAEMNKVAWCRSMLEEISNQEELLDRTSRIREYRNKTGVALFQTLTELEQQAARCKAMVGRYTPRDIDITLQMNTGKLEEWLQTNACSIVVKQPSANGHGQQLKTNADEASKTTPTTATTSKHDIDKSKSAPYSMPANDKAQTARKLSFKSATQISYFRSNISPEEKLGYAVGIGWIDDRLVVVDRWNKKIKLFNFDGSFLECVLFADGEPWDVAVIKETQSSGSLSTMVMNRFCLVAVPVCRVIIKIMIPVQGRMEIRSRIPTAVGYACISHTQTNDKLNLIVGGVCAPFGRPRVDLISMEGGVLRSIAVNHLQQSLFSSPRSVDISEDGIIAVSDWNRNKIIFLRSDGGILGAYEGTRSCKLREPVGTSLDGRGNVFVADKKAASIHVVKLGGEGMGALQIDTALQEPREINVSMVPRPRLAVAFGAGFIKVFDLFEDETEQIATCV